MRRHSLRREPRGRRRLLSPGQARPGADLLHHSDRGVQYACREYRTLLESRGINNVIVLGVHTNMCVLGRPFGLRQLAKNGKNVVLMRDMTDTMYNPARAPFVSHFRGTELIIEHVERYVCPTITPEVRGLIFRAPRPRRRTTIWR